MTTQKLRLVFAYATLASACSLVAPAKVFGQSLAFELPNVSEATTGVTSGDHDFTVVCFLGTQCPMAKVYAGRLEELHQACKQWNGRVVGVMSNRQDSGEEIQAFQKRHGLTYDIVVDRGNVVADQYGASRTPEVFLLDHELKLRYHGRIDDQYAPGVAKSKPSREDLKAAIEELRLGKPVSVKETRALGCVIGKMKSNEVPADGESPTFYRDVYPILQQHCIECHRTGEIGPFSMEQYEDVAGWADTMMETIDDGRMPPWHADPAHGKFANARHMAEADKELLRAWIAAGTIEGEIADKPAVQEYITGWNIGQEPDLVLPMRNRPFIVPQDGVVEYQYFVVDPEFEEDKWIKAAQVVPGAREVVHHAIVFVRPPDDAEFQGIGWLTAYVPGQRAAALPDGYARYVPAGSKLVFQMHYTPSGAEQADTSEIGLVFEDASNVTDRVFTLMALDQDFEIPPHDEDHAVSARLRMMPGDATLHAVTPHMHFRGKAFTLSAASATESVGSIEQEPTTLLRVPNYDFNWQHTYQLQRPLLLSQFRSIGFEATFDNSENNPFNPNPNEWVSWGDQTWEEMAVAFFEVSVPRKLSSAEKNAGTSNSASLLVNSDSDGKQRRAKIDAYVKRVLEKMDANGDGRVRKSEAEIIVNRWNFWRWDLNRDDVATADEIRQVAQKLYQ